jgi:dipeptidase
MCDTFVALPDATADGSVIFGKNSDREINEAHELRIIPRARHASASTLRATYIEIPQVAETHAVLLARPYWLWGAEMGANEHGVAIGNQAVFTRVPHEKAPGLIGMDLLRLALERAVTAREALDVITGLLEQYGQSGNCGHMREFHYHNSFILADPTEAWVLETAGREWAAVRVTSGVRSLSNAITIGAAWDRASNGLVEMAIRSGWCRRRRDFSFARCYSNRLYTYLSDAEPRRSCTTGLLERRAAHIEVADAFAALRSHDPDAPSAWRPDRRLTGATVCNHGGYGPVRAASQTVGSMVSRLRSGSSTHWLTGTSAPCTGVFKPAWIDAGMPELGPTPTGRYQPESLWWRHEALHRATLCDYAARLPVYAPRRDALESAFVKSEACERGKPAAERLAFSRRCFEAALSAERDWLQNIRELPISRRRSWHHARAWAQADLEAGFPAQCV